MGTEPSDEQAPDPHAHQDHHEHHQHAHADHDHNGGHAIGAERRTRLVLYATIVVMAIEIVYGMLSGSLALTADGWHMGSHAVALGMSVFAFAFARKHSRNRRFTFGTGKVSPLAGYTSALALAAVGLGMIWQSVERLWAPITVHFDEALVVAAIGLAFNLLSAFFLAPEDDHHHDHNLRAAYLHVVADALTSVLAIVALAGGKWLGWWWLDPAIGLFGAVIVVRWAWGLLRTTADVLLDAEDTDALEHDIRARIEATPGDQVTSLHLWRINERSFACMLAIESESPDSLANYKKRLAPVRTIGHLNIEVTRAGDKPSA